MALYDLKEKKNPYDIYVDNNKKVNSQLYDLSGTVTVPLAGAALENAQTESQYLASTGGVNHNLYNLEANKELDAQVAEQMKQAGTLYDLSKPTYGVKGKQLYDLGLNNSGYGKRLYDLNEEGYKKNLYDIAEGEKSAQQQIDANTEALKSQNLYNYSQYLAKYSTVLDDYETYKGKGMTDAQIQAQMLKDGYTADQINAVGMLRNERDLIPEGGFADRDTVLSSLNEGKVTKEWAQIQLLQGYQREDGAKIAEDVKNGLISQEQADAWSESTLKSYADQGAYIDYKTLDEWQRLGIISEESANEYKYEANAVRANLAANAFKSEEDLDKFLAAYLEGWNDPEAPSPDKYVGGEHSLAYKKAVKDYEAQKGNIEASKDILAFGHIVDLAKTGVFASSGKNADEMIANAAKGYTEKIKGANDNDAQMMLDEANKLYKEAKASGNTELTDTLRQAVGGMFVANGMTSVYEKFTIDVKDGILNLGNYAEMVRAGDPRIGGSDFAKMQQDEIAKYIKDRGIKLTYTTDYGHEPPTQKVVLSYRGTDYEIRNDLLTAEAKKALSDYGVVKERTQGTPSW